MVCTADGFGLLLRMIPYNPTLLLCLAAAVEEGHDLRSYAVVAVPLLRVKETLSLSASTTPTSVPPVSATIVSSGL